MKKFFCVFAAVLVSVSLFVVVSFAEDVVREDPLHSVDELSVLRSIQSPEYSLSVDGVRAFSSWLVSEGYISSSSAFVPPEPLYFYKNSAIVGVVDSVYVDGSTQVSVGGTSYSFSPSNSLFSFDSVDLYNFFTLEVGLSYSDFVYRDAPASVIGASLDIGASIFSVGSFLLSFITSSWITVLAFVAFVLVLGFGVIRKLVKGV